MESKHKEDCEKAEALEDDDYQRVNEPKCSPRALAIIFMNLYSLTAIGYQSFAKIVMQTGFSSVDMCLVRTFVNFLFSISTTWTSKKHIIHDVPQEHRLTLFIRSILGVIGFTSMIFAVKCLPIFIVTIIFNTSPFWTAIFAYFILGSTITVKEILLMIGCFSGVVLIAYSKEDQEAHEDGTPAVSKQQYLLGILCISATSLCYSSISVITRKMKEVHFSLILFHYTLIGSVILFVYQAIVHLADGGSSLATMPLFNYSWAQYKTALWSSLFNAVGMNLNTIAFQYEKNSAFLQMVGYMSLVYALVVDVALFKESFETLEIGGSLIVLAFTALTVYQKVIESEQKK